jgi:peptidoglycan/LPS O-acetylase OafA/YrhL
VYFSRNENSERLAALDSLRGLAALGVVFFHSPVPLFQMEFGWAGVNLFFILSGFLITSILLKQNQQPFRVYIKSFYRRRVLRIFPVYYLYLAAIFLILAALYTKGTLHDENLQQGFSDLKNNYPYLLTFTYNFSSIINFIAGKDYHSSVLTGHLWTLSVEVQFYAIFALMIYFVRERVLKMICVFFIILVPLLRLFAVLYFENSHYPPFWIGTILYNATIFQLDSLSIGCCIALFDFNKLVQNGRLYLTILILLICAIGAVHLFFLGGRQMEYSSLGYDIPVYQIAKQPSSYFILNNRCFYTMPLLNFTFGLLLLLLVKGKIASRFWNNQFLTSVGRISYSIYIYHLALSYAFILLIQTVFHKAPEQFDWVWQTALMGVYLAMVLLIAGLSYRLVERWFSGRGDKIDLKQ